MEIRQLRHFLALCEQRSFSRAAETVMMSQQALSHSIAQLEKELNVRLFDRGPFGAQMTDMGKVLLSRAKLICAEIDTVRREMETLTGGANGQINLGVSSSVAAALVPKVIVRYAEIRPKITISLTVDHSRTLYEKLTNGELDIVVTTPLVKIQTYEELEHEPIGEGFTFDANFLVMRPGHPLLSKPERSLANLLEYPWIMTASLGDLSSAVYQWLRLNELPAPQYVLRTDSLRGATLIVMQSDFVALTGREPAMFELDAGLLSGFALPGLQVRLSGYFSYRRRTKLQPSAAVLMQTFRNVIAELARPKKDSLSEQ